MNSERRISEHKITFIVAERDIESPFRATGAIIFEQFTKDTPSAVYKRGNLLANGRYGRVWIGQIAEQDLVPIEDFELDPEGE